MYRPSSSIEIVDQRRRIVRTVAEAEELHARLLNGAARTAAWLRNFEAEPMSLLKTLRFETVGHDPMQLHPDARGFRLALGTCSGRDIESVEPQLVAAEVFSATSPNSNQKLRKEIDRLAGDPARHRYVFFASPKYAAGRCEQLERPGTGIQVYATEP